MNGWETLILAPQLLPGSMKYIFEGRTMWAMWAETPQKHAETAHLVGTQRHSFRKRKWKLGCFQLAVEVNHRHLVGERQNKCLLNLLCRQLFLHAQDGRVALTLRKPRHQGSNWDPAVGASRQVLMHQLQQKCREFWSFKPWIPAPENCQPIIGRPR
jgi:hypothetical protein